MSISKNLLYVGLTITLLIGFIMLSGWKSPQGKQKVNQDTTRKSVVKKNSAKYSRKSVITFDENGEPHEELTENFDGDEELREMMKSKMNFDFNFPPMPDINMPDFSSMPDIDINIPDISFEHLGFHDMDTTDLKQFNLDMDKLRRELKVIARQLDGLGPEFEANMKKFNQELGNLDLQLDQLKDNDLNLKNLNNLNEDLDEEMKRIHETLIHELADPDKFNNSFSFGWAENMKDFEKEAHKELIKDGYLEEKEKIESISFGDNEIKFNGKVIQEEHVKKYREMEEKYMKRNRYKGKPE